MTESWLYFVFILTYLLFCIHILPKYLNSSRNIYPIIYYLFCVEQILICGILELEDSQEQTLHKECKVQRVVVRSL